jgi:hypothetical protein
MSDNTDNMVRTTGVPEGDSVIKGSNFPTPMGMAPVAPTDSAPQTPASDSTPTPPPPEPPQASSDGSDAQG